VCVVFCLKEKTAYEIGLGIPAEPLFRSLLLLLLVAPCLNCLEAVKKPPPVAFKVMCLLPIGNKTTNLTSKEAKMGKVMRHTLGRSEERRVGKEGRSGWATDH